MFSEQLKKLREDKGITQYELAEIIHVSRAAISKWERGQGIPSKCNLESLCSYFEVTEEEFISRKELIFEIEKNNKLKENIKYHFPVVFLTIFLLILSIVELFVFIREGIYLLDSGYYPNLSILTVLQGWSLIPIAIYILIITFNILFMLNTWNISSKVRLVVTISSCFLIVSCYLLTFIISFNLISPYNYGMFWKPHFVEKGRWY